jgi:hypothetical protein
MNKKKFRGKFVFPKLSIVLYKYAYTEKQAWLAMCREISKKHDLPLFNVTMHFAPENNNYTIEEE